MKVLFVDNGIRGHHFQYFDSLCSIKSVEPILVLPEYCPDSDYRQIKYNNIEGKRRNFIIYIKWLIEIKKIAKKTKPDIIHFLYGDAFYRYFGVGLLLLKHFRVLITFHEARKQKIQIVSLRMIMRHVTGGVVHSKYMKKMLRAHGLKNICHIEYPCFNTSKIVTEEAKKYWGIEQNRKVLGCLGSTDHYKGLDILLDALKDTKISITVLIAGAQRYFTEEYIRRKSKEYDDNIRIVYHLDYLTEEEFNCALNASDYIVLPYRKEFQGASGPLAEGVSLGKCIIGTDFGTIGNTIIENHLGYTFEAENTKALSDVINSALLNTFSQDDLYLSYQKSLDVKYFKKKYCKLFEKVYDL